MELGAVASWEHTASPTDNAQTLVKTRELWGHPSIQLSLLLALNVPSSLTLICQHSNASRLGSCSTSRQRSRFWSIGTSEQGMSFCFREHCHLPWYPLHSTRNALSSFVEVTAPCRDGTRLFSWQNAESICLVWNVLLDAFLKSYTNLNQISKFIFYQMKFFHLAFVFFFMDIVFEMSFQICCPLLVLNLRVHFVFHRTCQVHLIRNISQYPACLFLLSSLLKLCS